MSDLARFWLAVEGIGLLGMPIAALLFARVPTRGLIFGKPLGLLLLVFPIWMLPSLHLLPYGQLDIAVGFGGLALASVASLLMLWRSRETSDTRLAEQQGQELRSNIRLLLIGEVVFAACFLGWAVLRAYAPDVWGTEKPMDMAFITAINRSSYFPPNDPWLSGSTINYYYLGHLIIAVLLRLTGIEPSVGFNLAVCLTYALDVAAVFGVTSLLYALLRRATVVPPMPVALVGLFGAVFTMLLGNLAGAVQLMSHPAPLTTFDWWTPSRVIANTITEFPFFSFLLADLHAHMLASPFDLLAMAFSFQLAIAGPRLVTTWPRLTVGGVLELVTAALIVGAVYPMNGWDFPTELAIGAGCLYLFVTSGQRTHVRLDMAWWFAWTILAVALYLPFYLYFHAPTGGIGLVHDRTSLLTFLWDYGRIYGTAVIVLTPLFWQRLKPSSVPTRYVIWLVIAAAAALMLLEPAHLAGLLVLLAVLAFALFGTLDERRTQPERLFWLCVAAAIGLVTVGEVVYVRDAFDGGPDYRMNTVFKFGYQAWFVLMPITGVAVPWVVSQLTAVRRLAFGLALGVTVAAGLVYPVAGIVAREGGFQGGPTLDGLRWVAATSPGDVAAIHWIQANVRGAPVVLESVGQEYDPVGHARVSTFTGLPAVLGWAGHEAQWNHATGTRGQDVATIYSTSDIAQARALLERYNVTYVFVGSLERADFPPAGLAKFAILGRAVFSADGTIVYRLNGQ